MKQAAISQARRAYLILEDKLVTLELQPCQVLSERQLIELVGLGRTPVREAIQRLSWEGLIEVLPRSGIRVSDIRPEDYMRVMEPRAVLEPLLARNVARYANNGHTASLTVCAGEMETAAKSADVHAFLKADKVFDEILAVACPNKFITKVLAPLQTHSRRFWFHFGSTDGPEISAKLHVAVMQAISRKDEAAAERSMVDLVEYLSAAARKLL
ncbi:GntR family transcriptional regulator [Mesorhizobium koreense]|jgi:DNA-binding GntR family transcriptional regulator|uniref:GntR family transcriptional regulator n=1 Tax=Mesorhizobium koreense TaxID=3074855 RepID=UPI00287BC832|nr:GntR family transcriptional regulator [Mesorhizobium sp. WR6]